MRHWHNSTAQNYFNDANGNTTQSPGRQNTWDSQNRLVQCITGGKTSSFTYGADGLRRSMSVQTGTGTPVTTDYLLEGQSVVQEFNETTSEGVTTLNPIATYLAGPRGIEYRQDDTTSTPKRSWYLYDGLGSVIAEVDEGDSLADPTVVPELTAKPLTDVYGKALTTTPAAKVGFVGGLGHVTDADTGLTYMRARYYDPEIGRFVSLDPGRNGANWYVYASDNPVGIADDDGRFDIDTNDLYFRLGKGAVAVTASRITQMYVGYCGNAVYGEALARLNMGLALMGRGGKQFGNGAKEIRQGEMYGLATDNMAVGDMLMAMGGVNMIGGIRDFATGLGMVVEAAVTIALNAGVTNGFIPAAMGIW